MLIAHLAFWLLLIWAKKEEEIGWLEAAIYAVVWLASFGLSASGLVSPILSIVATILLDIILLFRNGIADATAFRI